MKRKLEGHSPICSRSLDNPLGVGMVVAVLVGGRSRECPCPEEAQTACEIGEQQEFSGRGETLPGPRALAVKASGSVLEGTEGCN